MSNGKFIWFEYLAKDANDALAFYTETVGWKTQSIEMATGPYRMLLVGDQPVGGVVDLPELAEKAGAPPHWLSYITTTDVDGCAAKATKLGGNVLQPPFDVPGVGRISVLQDPQGAVFAAFHPENDERTPSPDAEGAMVWSELATSDPVVAFAFYEALFGWSKTEAMEMEEGTYQMFTGGEASCGGIFDKPAEMPTSAWLHYANTRSLDDAIGRVTRHGGTLLNGPNDVPGGRVAQFVDPQGGAFALHEAS